MQYTNLLHLRRQEPGGAQKAADHSLHVGAGGLVDPNHATGLICGLLPSVTLHHSRKTGFQGGEFCPRLYLSGYTDSVVDGSPLPLFDEVWFLTIHHTILNRRESREEKGKRR